MEMKIPESVLDELGARIMKMEGIDSGHESFVMLEDNDNGEVFMKFMSDGGVTDNKNGKTLHVALRRAKVVHDYFDGRKFFMQVEDLKKFFGMEAEHGGNPQ